MKIMGRLLVILGLVLSFSACSWVYTVVQLNIARSKGVYESPEQGMLAFAEEHYTGDRDVKILYAGPNSFNGNQPHDWYVIAEVHASSREDGSDMKHDGCDAPGLAFLQTGDGWVYVPDGAFPGFIGFWMKTFNLAGKGQTTPTTDLLPDQPSHFCNSYDMIWHGR